MTSLHTIPLPLLDPNAFTGPVRQLSGMARSGTPILDVPYGEFARFIIVGTSGSISYLRWDGVVETLPFIVAGVLHPILSIQINSSGTSITANQIRWGS